MNQKVICISGDASFQMNLTRTWELYHNIICLLKLSVINNKWQGMVRQWQQAFYGERYSHSYMSNMDHLN